MHRIVDSPIVSFERDGSELVLGRGSGEAVLHRAGATGLGLPPAAFASTDRLTGDGTVMRGVRYGAREVFIPIRLAAASTPELTAMRSDLTALLAPHRGPVTIRVQDPSTGRDRSVLGYLREGLEGDFGDGFHGYWQTLGLTFECPDPWWRGAEQTESFRVNPGTKAFISDTVPFFPIVLAQSTVMGKFDVTIRGDGEVWPIWEILGPGEGLVITDGSSRIQINGTFTAGQVVRIDTREGRITPDRWADTPTDFRLFPLAPGSHSLTVTMAGASTDTLVRLTYRERYLEAL